MKSSRMTGLLLALCLASATTLQAATIFSTNGPDGAMAMASRPDGAGSVETEAADDFLLGSETLINHATFTGLLPTGVNPATGISQVAVEIYRVFPTDSDTSRTISVPTRTNSPSDVAFATRDLAAANLTFTATLLNPIFTAANSVDTGIHPKPNQTTLGEGSVTGQEVAFDVTFATPLDLPADHYFFVPQVLLSDVNQHFFWLSAPKPIAAPGTPFMPDLQAWIRNANLDPDWLRVGTDIVGGTTPPTFNGAFSLDGEAVPEPSVVVACCSLLVVGLVIYDWRRMRQAA